MASKEFNCNKIKRSFWTFTMKDKITEKGETEKGETLVVRMPKKEVFEAIKNLTNAEDGYGVEDLSAAYDLIAAALSNNMNNIKVSPEELKDYDIEECTAILNGYMQFVDELRKDPN